MSNQPRVTLIGMYNYDQELFANLNLPNGIDKDTLINTLLLSHGERPLLYPSIAFMKTAIGIWSAKNRENIERLKTALTAEYNPIHNFDRFEETSDARQTNGTTNGHSTGKDETENLTSAFNADSYQPDAKSEGGSESNTSGSSSMTDNYTHKGHLYGNIGVTRSQEMIEDEIKLRTANGLYDILSNMFSKEFCLYIY